MLNELPNTYPFSPGSSRPLQTSHAGRNSKSKWGSAGKDGAKSKTKSRPKNSDSSDKPGETPEINRPVTHMSHWDTTIPAIMVPGTMIVTWQSLVSQPAVRTSRNLDLKSTLVPPCSKEPNGP